MRKGFTMIELIFVIVILGILAAVAIPRLSATRDDAEAAKAATNVATFVTDVTSYYTSQGQFANNWKDMTQVAHDGVIKVVTDSCVTFTKTADTLTATATKIDGKCQYLFAMPAMKNFFGKATVQANDKKDFKVGGTGVVFESAPTTGGTNPNP